MTDTTTSTIASFHLIRYDSARAMRHMAFDRPLLRRTGGLLFWRLLGTGRGRAMSLGADLRRWALFAVWRGEDDLDEFLRASPIAARWRAEASEYWQARLSPMASRGAWSGRDPFAPPPPLKPSETPRGPSKPTAHTGDTPGDSHRAERVRGMGGSYRSGATGDIPGEPLRSERVQGVGGFLGSGVPGDAPRKPLRGEATGVLFEAPGAFGAGAARRGGGPVAVLTRASIRPRRLVAFYRSVPPVDELLRRQDGCLASIGIGEWPLARQATFSLWRDREAVRAFAYRGEAHRRVIERVRADDWYAEELFARFTPYASEGTWDGADPLR
ncbi:hypothetical protein AB0K05_12540 [Nonomuraea sp. NPDC049486]|uniref:hypothetical protein n=1 Tax=unclassified Nonomuraea TaxID=2593643 RepID=UPI003422438C